MDGGIFLSFEKITKIDLVDSIYKNTNCQKTDIQKIVDAFLDSVKKCLSEGNSIELRGFGTFEPRLRKARENTRNPKSGEVVSMVEHYVAAFRAGKELKHLMYTLTPHI